jgi:hypothetical protein
MQSTEAQSSAQQVAARALEASPLVFQASTPTTVNAGTDSDAIATASKYQASARGSSANSSAVARRFQVLSARGAQRPAHRLDHPRAPDACRARV